MSRRLYRETAQVRQWYQRRRVAARKFRREHPVHDAVRICLLFFMAGGQFPYVLDAALAGTHPLAVKLQAPWILACIALGVYESVQLWRVRRRVYPNGIEDEK